MYMPEKKFKVAMHVFLLQWRCVYGLAIVNSKNNKKEPDLMWKLDVYARLDMADAWVIIGPINWYAPSSNLKLMFDRLVCMNGGNPDEKSIEHKNPEKAMQLEHSKLWEEISLNHLEGRTAAFFCYGDEGGNELDETGRPKILRHKEYFDPNTEPFENERDAYAPLVWQCRYGGVEVPDHLWKYALFGKDRKYSESQAEDMVKDKNVMAVFDEWTKDFISFVQNKGKVKPNKYRAFGYKPPLHFWANIKDGLRYFRMMIGKPPKHSSPYLQQKLKLVNDATWQTKKGEGEKLRSK